MNMILHGHETAELRRGNTLAAPEFKNPDDTLKTFDFAVANPLFSAKAWSNGLDPAHDAFGRFEYGIPPARNGDYAFLLHLVTSLKSKGKGAIILPHGVLFQGNREAGIRRELVRHSLLKGVSSTYPPICSTAPASGDGRERHADGGARAEGEGDGLLRKGRDGLAAAHHVPRLVAQRTVRQARARTRSPP